jgi:hypothetical protein
MLPMFRNVNHAILPRWTTRQSFNIASKPSSEPFRNPSCHEKVRANHLPYWIKVLPLHNRIMLATQARKAYEARP